MNLKSAITNVKSINLKLREKHKVYKVFTDILKFIGYFIMFVPMVIGLILTLDQTVKDSKPAEIEEDDLEEHQRWMSQCHG